MEAIFSGASTSRRGRPPATDPFLELDISLSPNQHRGRIMRVLRPPADTSLLAAGRAACLPRSTRQVLSNRATQNNTTPRSTQWTLSWPRSKVPPRTVDRSGCEDTPASSGAEPVGGVRQNCRLGQGSSGPRGRGSGGRTACKGPLNPSVHHRRTPYIIDP